ncbi:MAG: ATP-binding protein, partial [Anaerolineales bacterium]
IDDLLEFLQLGRVPIRKREVSPTSIARLALGKLPAYLDNQHIHITIGDMPLCQADPDLLTQVYTHLLDNAIKFSRSNPAAEIQVGSFEREGEIIYFVRDNGIGFDMQYVGKLFGMFAQLNRPGEFEGNGVGLATVQRIIRRHGGRVWAEGEPGRGATFYFTLPD